MYVVIAVTICDVSSWSVVTSTLLASDTFNQNQLFNTDCWKTGHTSPKGFIQP